jgi:hypothetical protein
MTAVFSLVTAFLLAAAPPAPPRMQPLVAIEFDVADSRPARVLEVFDGQYHRADWIDKKTGKVDQRFWSQDEARGFYEFLKSIKLPSRGRAAVTSDSAEGKKLLEKIDAMIIQPRPKAEPARPLPQD